MPSIEIRDLSFRYTGSPAGKKALDSVSLFVEDGEFLCVVGASGCGKSTLLRVLAGLENPESGSVFLGENKVSGPGSERMIVFQDYALFPWMTAKKNTRATCVSTFLPVHCPCPVSFPIRELSH